MKKTLDTYFLPLGQVIFLVFLLLFVGQSYAQTIFTPSFSPDKHITQFSIDTWDTEQGLPSRTLSFIEQTSDGYLWIVSYQGLFRFDGVTFETFDIQNSPQSLKTNVVQSLFERGDGVLCLNTSGDGLLAYKNGKFEQIAYLDVGIQTLLYDSPTHAWAGTRAYGVYELNDSTFSAYAKVPVLNNISIADIFKDREGNIWFATEGKGLVKIDKNGESTVFTIKEGLLSNKVKTIFQDSQSRIWVGTNNGLCFFEEDKIKVLEEARNYPINKIIEDYYGSLWMATEKGILRRNIKTKEIELLTEKNGLPHKNIKDILLDREGSLWFNTYRAGLGRIKEGKFSNYTTYTGLASKAISSIHEITKGEYLVATDVGIINRIKGNKISKLNFKTKLPNDRLKHLNSDSRGNILISTYSGLLIIAPDGSEKLYNKNNGLSGNQVRVTYEDHLGNIWIGTRVNGLIKMTPEGVFTFYTKTNSNLSSNFIMSIGQDKDKNLLVGTNDSGLDIIDLKNNFGVINYTGQLTSKMVFSTYTDIDNTVWIASNSGLNRIKNNKITQYSTKNGLLANNCFDIQEDDIGYLWVSTNMGIMRILKEELADIAEGKIKKIQSIKIFTKADGMVTTECTGATFSTKTQDGHLMFPTLSGVTFIKPENFTINKVKPPVLIEKLVVDKQEVTIHKEIAIEPDKQRFIFSFTALSLVAPKKTSLKYKLEGYDKNWIESERDRQAIYTSLPHGKYTFRVKASNNDGVWNEEGANLEFEILPHFYNRTPFYIFVFLLLALLIYGIYRFRIRSIRQKNKALEALVVQRTHEINAQNEELLSQKDKIQEQHKNLAITYDDISTLSKIGREVTSTLDISKLNEVLYGSINKLMKADGFGVGFYNKKTDSLDFRNYIENGKILPFLAEKISETNSLAVKCFKDNEVILVQDLKKMLPYKRIGAAKTVGIVPEALIYLPLVFENKAIGILTVQSFEKGIYTEQDVTILRTLSSYISIALVNADSYAVIQDKNKLITDKNNLITDSIRYAERIQQAVLPSQDLITDNFSESFVLFSPKDIVSGDFYWFDKAEGKLFIAVADCTGHGVPGAFMSMIGMASLSEIVDKEATYSPAEILTKLHQKIRISLKQDQAINDDGMDIALCVLEKQSNQTIKIIFSGAKLSLSYSQDGQLKELKGNRKSIGGQVQNKKVFSEEEIVLPQGESIYLFSDGIADQHAANRKRFGSPLLKKILRENLSKPLIEQKQIISKELKSHQGNMPQRDDIVMLGIRF